MREPTHWLGAASDIGRRHNLNQDAFSLGSMEEPRSAVIAVSDGVTTAPQSEIAAVLATSTARAELQLHLSKVDIETAFLKAFHEAHYAVLSRVPDAACTLVAAVLSEGWIHVGCVGDSRAYWFPDEGGAQLMSTDDSVAQVRINLGMDRAAAEASSHAITRWLGRETTDVRPTLQSLHPESSGYLVVCSDGLWNYASEPGELAEIVRAVVKEDPSPGIAATALVEWANNQGGRDNVTVAVLRVDQDL